MPGDVPAALRWRGAHAGKGRGRPDRGGGARGLRSRGDGATRADRRLPWPATTAAQVASLQIPVDGGAQPWLLEPTQVALAYAAARGWTDAAAVDTTAAA